MTDADDRRAPILVLGLGNLLLHDDATGLHLLAALRARYGDDSRVEFADGGTQGLALLPVLEGRAAVLILDAVHQGDPPGSVHRLDDALQQPPRGHGGAHGGAHAPNAGDLLLTARLLGQLPRRVAVCGVEPGIVHTGIGLSPAVIAALPAALATADAMLSQLLAPQTEPCTS